MISARNIQYTFLYIIFLKKKTYQINCFFLRKNSLYQIHCFFQEILNKLFFSEISNILFFSEIKKYISNSLFFSWKKEKIEEFSEDTQVPHKKIHYAKQ